MRSQIRFVMHPSDESDFVTHVLLDESVCLVDGPRWKSAIPQTFRVLERISGSYCIIWSTIDVPSLDARYIPSCNDWYCESEDATIQFLRSQVLHDVIIEGRLAISTSNDTKPLAILTAKGVERRYKLLSKFIKKHYVNSVVHWCNPSLPFGSASLERSANPGKPDPQLWIGPHALQWLQENQARRIKVIPNSLVEARLVGTA